jgi:hypothetical protein
MSNDPIARGTNEVPPGDVPNADRPLEPTRRTFLQYVSAGVAVATLPAIPGCAMKPEDAAPGQHVAKSVDVEQALASAVWVPMLRKDDLLSFNLGLVNLAIASTATTPKPVGLTLNGNLFLQRQSVDQTAFLIVDFQPQHILEQAFGNDSRFPPVASQWPTMPVNARLAEKSRVVFIVPDNVSALPFELGAILEALASYGLNVAGNALPNPQTINWPVPIPIVLGGNGVTVTNPAPSLPAATRKSAPLQALRLGHQRRALKGYLASNPEVRPPADLVKSLAVVNGPGNGVIGVPIINPPPVLPPSYTIPVKPNDLETQIELPFRLLISPNAYASFTHETVDPLPPPPDPTHPERVELWHTSMTAPAGYQTIRALWTRDVDFTPDQAGDSNYYAAQHDAEPFIASLYDQDRADIVQLTTNYTLLDDQQQTRTRAVDVERLMLSTLGGWLDCHGAWADPPGFKPSPNPATNGPTDPALVAWDHVADMGRDNYVRVARFGYLFPWGHKAVKVVVTKRQIDPTNQTNPAYLWQDVYIIVKERLRTYDQLPAPYARGVPFTSVRFKTLTTPALDGGQGIPNLSASQWLVVNGNDFRFDVEAFDQEGNKLTFGAAAAFIDYDDAFTLGNDSAAFGPLNNEWTQRTAWMSDLKSQRVAYAPHNKPDDTRHTTTQLGVVGIPVTANGQVVGVSGEAPWVPQLGRALLAIDTIRGMTGNSAAQPFSYCQPYIDNGFDGSVNVGEVLLKAGSAWDPPNPTLPKLDVSKQSKNTGGFVAPSMAVTGLSRSHGLVSGNPDLFAAGGDTSKPIPSLSGVPAGFNPQDFFNSALASAKLFGCLNISDIIVATGIGDDFFKQTPKFLTQALGPIEELLDTANAILEAGSDLDTLLGNMTTALSNLAQNVPPQPPNSQGTLDPVSALMGLLQAKANHLYGSVQNGIGPLETQVGQVQSAVTAAVAAAQGLGTTVTTAISNIAAGGPGNDVASQVTWVTTQFQSAVAALQGLTAVLQPGLATSLPLPVDPGLVNKALGAIKKISDFLNGAAFNAALTAFLNAEDAIENLHIKIEWSPTLSAGPPGFEIFQPGDPHGLKVGIEIRGKESDGQPAGADVYASLSNFTLGLIGTNPVIVLQFEKLSFTVSTNADPDVDCKFDGIQFAGALSFVNVLRQLIPLDGFSDPPDINVDSSGITASFGLPLPNIAVGVFSLENISINAGFTVPFIGKSLSVDFSFCTRESPFVLTVMMIGGGGFVGVTLTPAGVQKLEVSLEATACLAVDFGIASGSISISVGIYICIEQNDCKLTGYLKFNGNVEVLGGLFGASITLDLELSYQSQGNKVVGEADLEISVSIFFFHISVSAHVRRQLNGDNNDPTFRDAMAPYSCASNLLLNPPDPTCLTGMEYPWNDYVAAFVPLQAA